MFGCFLINGTDGKRQEGIGKGLIRKRTKFPYCLFERLIRQWNRNLLIAFGSGIIKEWN